MNEFTTELLENAMHPAARKLFMKTLEQHRIDERIRKMVINKYILFIFTN
jgi:hypothetical protein